LTKDDVFSSPSQSPLKLKMRKSPSKKSGYTVKTGFTIATGAGAGNFKFNEKKKKEKREIELNDE